MKKKLFGRALLGPMTAAERAKGRYMRDPNAHPMAGVLERHAKAVEAKLDEAGVSMVELKARMEAIEQKADRPKGGGLEVKTFGRQVGDSRHFKSFRDGGYRGHARIELKATTTMATAGTNWSDRDADVVGMARRQTRVRDLLTVVPTGAGSVDYAQQSVRQNAAGPVAEGQQKPYSSYAWTKKNQPMRTIAHLAKLTRQAMDDADQLAAEVDAEMQYGLTLAEDAQLLYGDGTGENLTGMNTLATAYAAPAGIIVAQANMIDQIGLAIVQLALSEYQPDGVVLNPVDWWQAVLLKDTQGHYLLGQPGGVVQPRLFGLPVAVTTAQTAGKFLTGAFAQQKLYDRMAPEVLISSENADDFEKNMLTMRCEERLGLAVRRPDALIRGTFGA